MIFKRRGNGYLVLDPLQGPLHLSTNERDKEN